MTFREALEAVSLKYIPGVVAYYGKQNPDPWQQAHERLEESLAHDTATQSAACEAFVQRCLELVDLFKRVNTYQQIPKIRDGLVFGSIDQVRQIQSQRQKFCFYCSAEDGLVLINHPDDIRKALVVCRECKARKSA